MKTRPSILVVCLLGLALRFAEGIVIRKMSGRDACGVRTAKLGHDIEPSLYHISLRLTDLKAEKFDGIAEIDVKVNGNRKNEHDNLHSNQIFLNADESMELQDVWYEKTNAVAKSLKMKGTRVEVVGVCLNTDHQILVVTLAKDLQSGSRGKLGFRYRAKFGKVGLRRSAFNGGKSLHLMFAGDQFARRVFPSFDEPTFPANFALEVVCSPRLRPLSNEVSDLNDDDKLTKDGNKVNKFAPTSKIATKNLVMSLFTD